MGYPRSDMVFGVERSRLGLGTAVRCGFELYECLLASSTLHDANFDRWHGCWQIFW